MASPVSAQFWLKHTLVGPGWSWGLGGEGKRGVVRGFRGLPNLPDHLNQAICFYSYTTEQETGELRGLMENRMPQSRAPSPLKSGVTHPTHDCRYRGHSFLGFPLVSGSFWSRTTDLLKQHSYNNNCLLACLLVTSSVLISTSIDGVTRLHILGISPLFGGERRRGRGRGEGGGCF